MKECSPGSWKLRKLEEKRFMYLQDIDNHKTEYFEVAHKMNHNNQAITAFIIFRSMEGVERCKYAFDTWRITRAWFSLFTCCATRK